MRTEKTSPIVGAAYSCLDCTAEFDSFVQAAEHSIQEIHRVVIS